MKTLLLGAFLIAALQGTTIAIADSNDDTLYFTGANLSNPNVLIRIDNTYGLRSGVQSVSLVQGACWFNGRGFATAPRWKANVDLQGRNQLKKAQLFVGAFNQQHGWREEVRPVTPAEAQHYVNCDWPRDMWAFQTNHVLTGIVRPLDSAMAIEKVVRVDSGPNGSQLVHVILGPCERKLMAGESLVANTYLPSGLGAIRPGDVLVPSGSISAYQLMDLIRPAYHRANASERRHYATCDWPESMKRP